MANAPSNNIIDLTLESDESDREANLTRRLENDIPGRKNELFAANSNPAIPSIGTAVQQPKALSFFGAAHNRNGTVSNPIKSSVEASLASVESDQGSITTPQGRIAPMPVRGAERTGSHPSGTRIVHTTNSMANRSFPPTIDRSHNQLVIHKESQVKNQTTGEKTTAGNGQSANPLLGVSGKGTNKAIEPSRTSTTPRNPLRMPQARAMGPKEVNETTPQKRKFKQLDLSMLYEDNMAWLQRQKEKRLLYGLHSNNPASSPPVPNILGSSSSTADRRILSSGNVAMSTSKPLSDYNNKNLSNGTRTKSASHREVPIPNNLLPQSDSDSSTSLAQVGGGQKKKRKLPFEVNKPKNSDVTPQEEPIGTMVAPATSKRPSTSTSSSEPSSEGVLRRSKRSMLDREPVSCEPRISINEVKLSEASNPLSIDRQRKHHNLDTKAKTRISLYPFHSRASMLRNRDIGRPTSLNQSQFFVRVRDSCLDTMIKPWRNWTGASRDIICSAWAPDGLSFIVGSSTDLDARNQIYNRGNNLLWCDLTESTIAELDDHKMERPVPEPGSSQSNTALSTILDEHVFTTVSDVCYASYPNRFYTASYDKTVKIWEVSTDTYLPKCVETIEHNHQVNILSKCHAASAEVLATAQKSKNAAVQIFQFPDDRGSRGTISTIPQTTQAVKHNLIPTALAWGHSATGTGDLLVAGFGDENNETTRRSRGDIAVWDAKSQATVIDLETRYQCIYDLAWHTQTPLLAAASNADPKPYRCIAGTQSSIRVWQPKQGRTCNFNLDCLALDINRLVLHPFDPNIISAACTDGSIYHYDLRFPETCFASLKHGNSIAQLDPEIAREKQDYGIEFLSWNAAGTLIYSGSSDGKVKQWNPYLHEKDAFITDIASFDSGVSCGRFSPDFTNLLIGTAKGSVHILSSAPVTPWREETENELSRSSHKEVWSREAEEGIEKSEQFENQLLKYRPAGKS